MRRLALPILLGLAVSSCGVGPGEDRGGDGVTLRVTRDFGSSRVAQGRNDVVREGDTVMGLLRAEVPEVDTAYGGKFIQSIAGIEGGGPEGRRDWFFFVNGIEGSAGAAATTLESGDVVHWDYRDWSEAMSVPAIVGAWPEPFLHGREGRRIPTRVQCADETTPACDEVKRRLTDAGILATGAPLASAGGEDVLRVIVGPWPELRDLRAAAPLAAGPGASGVYAELSDDGAVGLLDAGGDPAGEATGIVAATAGPGEAPTWFVTGATEANVGAAARMIDSETLRDRYAVATDGGEPIPLPVRSP